MSHNLAFAINLPNSNEDSKVIRSVNETFAKFCNDFSFQSSIQFLKLHKNIARANKSTAIMEIENTILCETNSGLWTNAIASSVATISNSGYPHYIVVQKLINHILNSPSPANIGIIEEFFWKLLVTYSPKPEFFKYYQSILFHNFLKTQKQRTENQNLFLWLIETLATCLSKPEFSELGNNEEEFLEKIECFNDSHFKNFLQKEKSVFSFEDLPWLQKVKRCLVLLNFLCDILEIDFVTWFKANKAKPFCLEKENRPLICHCLWQQGRDTGLMNKNVMTILNAFKLFEQLEFSYCPHSDVLFKLIHLIAEVFRCADRREIIKYPYIGPKSSNLARELSLKFYENLFDSSQQSQHSKVMKLILNLKPEWFRLVLCSYLINAITGFHTTPDLTGAYDILEHIAHGEFEQKEDIPQKSKRATSRARDTGLEQKFKKLKGINALLLNGNTPLQSACEENNLKEVKALLTFPDLNVNAPNHDGWTALHLAASKGHTKVVKALLKFIPNSESFQRPLDTRARGPESFTPLMCAASGGHAKICRLLLEHSGSDLLQDVSESNQTPLELATNKEVVKIMKHFEVNFLRTPHSRRNIIVDEKYKEIVTRLCVEMIQAYFCTYRTWDVYKHLKRQEEGNETDSSNDSERKPHLDYQRYHRDIIRNIDNLKALTPKLEDLQEFKSSSEIYTLILSLD